MDCQKTTRVFESELDVILRSIAQSAAVICGCPIALLRIQDISGRSFLLMTGLDDLNTTVHIEPLLSVFDLLESGYEVHNASNDSRFRGVPMVASPPFISFISSVAIRDKDSHCIGNLSVMAAHEIQINDTQRIALKELAGIAAWTLHRNAIAHPKEHKSPPTNDSQGNDLLAMAVRDNQIGTWEFDLGSRQLQWNDVMFELFGGSRDTFEGSENDWLKSVHPTDVHRVKHELMHAVQNSVTFSSEYRVCDESGRVKYINAQGTVVRDPSGKPIKLIGSNRDVSDRVKAQSELERSERRLRLITDKLPVLIASIDRYYRYTFANNNFESWYALGARNIPSDHVPGVIGKTVEDVFEPASFHAIKPYLDQAMAGKEISVELDMPPSKTPPHIFLYCCPERDDQGQIIGVFGLVMDRTTEVQARKRIAESEHQLRSITDNLPALIAYVDKEERIRFINRTYCERLNTTKESAIGKPISEVEGSEAYAKRRDFFLRALRGERVEVEAVYGENSAPVFMQTKLVPDRGTDGQVKGVFKLCTDVSELKRVEAELRKMARVDVLTGLPNRRQFIESLKLAHDRTNRTGAVSALLYLDIDHFKQVNDSKGHGVGDSVLSEFAQRLKSSIRSTDTAARLAGDEFVVILEDLMTEKQALTIAAKINVCVREPMLIDAEEIRITTSIGIAFHRGPITDLNDWISRADHALYQVKANGRDTFGVESVRC